MFDWLELEISAIKTPRFHRIDGPVDEELRDAIVQTNLPVPASYREFVLKFGNARLYRDAHNDSYQVGVFAGPRLSTLSGGTHIYHLGFHDGASVYVKPPSVSEEYPIFEFETGLEQIVAEDFEEWLEASCADARNSYGKMQWAEILRGPKPFTAEEKEIIDTRRRIQWRVLAIDSNGDHILEVTNTGIHVLPFLKIGVRSTDGRLNGGVRLDIGHIGPGQTGLLHVDCYKDLKQPQQLELFSLPDPKPEDRARYPELEGR